MRVVVVNLVRIAILYLAVRSLLVEPIAVQSGSMAPVLRGLHGDTKCPRCGADILWGADLTPFDVAAVVCPRCGSEQSDEGVRTLLAGDRLLVDRNAFWLRAPHRWEIATFRDPEAPHRWLVKRIVGLPGESITIRDGDLYSSGKRVTKSLDALRSLAIPLYEPTQEIVDAKLAPWQGETETSPWQSHRGQRGESFLHLPTLSATEFDWLVYRPVTGTAVAGGKSIGDALPYNQDRQRRPLPVSDVLVTFMARFQGQGRLAVRFPVAGEVVLLLDPKTGDVDVLEDGVSQFQGRFRPPTPGSALAVMVGYCDGRVLAQLGEEQLVAEVAGSAERAESAPPLGIGASGIGVEITGLRLARDIFYTPSDRERDPDKSFALGEQEYLMLGDNPARSYDSRYWSTPGIDHKSLLGRPFLVHGASHAARMGSWTFQVPDFERIRYIPPAVGE
jgi:signal peptidase I